MPARRLLEALGRMPAGRAEYTPATLLAALREAADAGDAKAAAFLPTFEPLALVHDLLDRLSARC
jgi:hypothetical protein